MSDVLSVTLTPAGFARLQQRLVRKLDEYEDIRAQRQVAFELSGDGWHDNPEFNRAQQMEANCNREIKKLNDMLALGRVVEIVEGQRPTAEVAVGSLVTFVRWGDDGPAAEETWEIGGHGDSDPQRACVAYDAPLGAALFGLKVGEYAEEVQLGEALVDLEIVALHPRHPDAP
ncbi:GreA/GreB family elongation factor [Pseudomonas sp. AN-1]|uniref:GreA/GreB family elongation factor n=1 Tax=Pseudomonas sp. AN-1 TaxID=3096605 RepID=UPI002A6A48D0|nr:GreA/GreB family elongation factor [Pseudomonas sp. AN-1]WPP46944.1 GreA/GreB family elongation factor [Pseudomonas sp. AN-1]